MAIQRVVLITKRAIVEYVTNALTTQLVTTVNCVCQGTLEVQAIFAGTVRDTVCDQDGTCSCKDNVVGTSCDQCSPGHFNLSLDNENGCQGNTVSLTSQIPVHENWGGDSCA